MTHRKLIWLFPVMMICTACPYESGVPLTRTASEPVDSSLIGYWYGIVKDGSDFFGIEALDISASSDSVYSIIRYGKAIKGDMILPDTAYYKAYSSRIGDLRFLSVEGTVKMPSRNGGYDEKKVYYLSDFTLQNDTLSIRTVTEDFTPRKDFRSPEDLSSLIQQLTMQKKNIFDDLYSLSYRRIEKPSR